MMMLTQMALKQIAINSLEYFLPLKLIRPKLLKCNEKHADTIDSLEVKNAHDEHGCHDAKYENLPDQKKIRNYQAERDFVLAESSGKVLDDYMELTIQFGFIVLFSSVFPLAAFMSLISNNIQMQS